MIRMVVLLLLSTTSLSSVAGPCAGLIEQMENIGELKKILYCLDNQSNVSRAEPRSFQKGRVKTKLTVERYLFELVYCSRIDTRVSCNLVITNKNKTIYPPEYREFGIYTAQSQFFDEYGIEYPASTTQMGQVKVDTLGQSNRQNFKDGYLEKYMPLGVPMRLTITFDDVGHKATTVMALNIKFSYRDGKELAAKYMALEGIGIEGG